ncbi:hypothetical protein Tco_0425862 [Tanacetum coccineum]
MALNRSKSRYAIKECSTCGSWYTKECCSIGNLNDQIIVPVPDSSVHCAVCGTPVDGPYCHGCTLIRTKFEKDLFAYCVDNRVFQNFQDTPESSNDNTNVVNAPREPSVVDQDPGVDIPQDPPQIDHNCCYECGDSLNGIFCQKCICGSCGKDSSIASKEMLHAQTILRIYAKLLEEYITYSHNEKSIKLFRSGEKFFENQTMVEEEQTQPDFCEYYHRNMKSTEELRAEWELSKSKSTLNKVNFLPEMRIQIGIQKQHWGGVGIYSLNRDSPIDSTKTDSIFDEFSFPRLPEEHNSENVDTIIESLSYSPIPVEDSDSLIEEIDLFLTSDDSMPPDIESDDYDSEGDFRFLEELLINDSLPLPENESYNLNSVDNPESPVVKSCFDFEPVVAVTNDFDVLNDVESFDSGEGENVDSLNIEEEDSFTFTIRSFLPFVTYPEERIEKTKRSKNSQKPTRNERDKNKSEESAKDQSRISPTQQERQSKVKGIKLRTISDKFSKSQGLIWKCEVSRTKVAKVERCLLKKKREIKTTRTDSAIFKPLFTLH